MPITDKPFATEDTEITEKNRTTNMDEHLVRYVSCFIQATVELCRL